MNLLFFGDSLVAGENSEYGFTDCITKHRVQNRAVSGTTIGEYSIYPVDGYSLLRQIGKYEEDIKRADFIFLGYGNNDVSAIMCGFATVQTVSVSLIKAVDWIYQINPDVKNIIFLTPGSKEIIHNRSKAMCEYLEMDYFANYAFKFPVSVYEDNYQKLLDIVRYTCDILGMFDDEMLENMDEYISNDGLHPNEKGHSRIADNLMQKLNQYYQI